MSRTISSAFIFTAMYDSINIRQIYEERRKKESEIQYTSWR